MDEKYLWMEMDENKKMDELFHEHWQRMFFAKNLNKINKMEIFYVGLF
jgi:hypothetical protein